MSSFRFDIARRAALAVGAILLATAVTSAAVLRILLHRELDGTLLHIAQFESRFVELDDDGGFRFRIPTLVAGTDADLPALARFAQLRDAEGRILLRSPNLGDTLPPPLHALAAAGEGARQPTETHRHGDQRLRSLIYPIQRPGRLEAFLLQVSAPYDGTRATLFRFGLLLALLTVTATALAAWLSWHGASIALRPTRAITDEAAAMGPGDLSARITSQAHVAEFEDLVAVLNAMLDRIERSFRSMQQFTADAGHELRGPLSVLRGEIDLALRRPRTAEEYKEALLNCRVEAYRLTRLAIDLLTLTRAESGHLQPLSTPVELHSLTADLVRRHARVAEERRIRVELDGDPTPVTADAELLERAAENLLRNAIDHTPAGGRVMITVRPGSQAEWIIRDEGPGIAEEQTSHLFDRFYRADPARTRGGGTGLGLAIARAAAEAHGGRLEFAGNAPGAVFRMTLPGAGSD